MASKLDPYIAAGYELKEEFPGHYVVERNNSKPGWHLVILLCFPIIGNIIYHFASVEKKTILK